MGDTKVLSGGVPDKNFKIIKWTAEDRSGVQAQYGPVYKNESLAPNQQPLRTLGAAQAVTRDWYNRREGYLRMKKQGHVLKDVERMLMEKGMIES